MLKKLALAAAILAIIAYGLWPEPRPRPPYNLAQLTHERRQKDAAFQNDTASPLPQGQRAAFIGLRYFAPDSTAVVFAQLERFARPETLQLALSKGPPDAYLRWGRARFTYPAASGPAGTALQQLTLFKRLANPDSTLFLPFTDQTNGRGSYGGGRYLDVPLPPPGSPEIVLDFNRAYNPFCAYNPAYRCPVPPPENRLSIAVAAGEKAFHD